MTNTEFIKLTRYNMAKNEAKEHHLNLVKILEKGYDSLSDTEFFFIVTCRDVFKYKGNNNSGTTSIYQFYLYLKNIAEKYDEEFNIGE